MESRHRAAAVGHRVVHGGLDFTGPVKVDEEVVGKLEKMIRLASLHQPYNLAAIRPYQNIARFAPGSMLQYVFPSTMPAIAGDLPFRASIRRKA